MSTFIDLAVTWPTRLVHLRWSISAYGFCCLSDPRLASEGYRYSSADYSLSWVRRRNPAIANPPWGQIVAS